MIVFDVDGTLLLGEAADWASFDSAVTAITGFVADASFYDQLEEVTARAIVHRVLADRSPAERTALETAVHDLYLRNLQAALQRDSACFAPAVGAIALLQHLRASDIPVAIATGDWRATIRFKLAAAGISVEGLPLVTASEFHRRADIIADAVRQAGQRLDQALYIGDGLWDHRACLQLGIPFIGVGSRLPRLRAAGVAHTLPDLTPEPFLALREEVYKKRSTAAAPAARR